MLQHLDDTNSFFHGKGSTKSYFVLSRRLPQKVLQTFKFQGLANTYESGSLKYSKIYIQA